MPNHDVNQVVSRAIAKQKERVDRQIEIVEYEFKSINDDIEVGIYIESQSRTERIIVECCRQLIIQCSRKLVFNKRKLFQFNGRIQRDLPNCIGNNMTSNKKKK